METKDLYDQMVDAHLNRINETAEGMTKLGWIKDLPPILNKADNIGSTSRHYFLYLTFPLDKILMVIIEKQLKELGWNATINLNIIDANKVIDGVFHYLCCYFTEQSVKATCKLVKIGEESVTKHFPIYEIICNEVE